MSNRLTFLASPVVLGAFLLPAAVQAASADTRDPQAGQVTRQEVGAQPEESNNEIILTDSSSVLTPSRRFFIEPSFSYTNSSSTQVAVEGFSVIPAIVIGLINVSQVQRDTLTSAVSFRYGLTERLELGVKLPYIYRETVVRQREALKGTPVDSINSTEGDGLGDVEASLNYQFQTSPGSPNYWIASLQVKSRTGKDPFEVQQRFLSEDTGDDGFEGGEQNNGGETTGVVLLEQPTGSGFWSFQPGITYIHQSDPVVLYGSLSYLWNQKRDVGPRFGGVIDPGDAIGAGFGMGISLNSNTSFTLGYSHTTMKRTRFENDFPGLEPSFSRFQVGSLRFGVSHRVSRTSSLKLALGIGVTDAAPDVQWSFSMPFVL